MAPRSSSTQTATARSTTAHPYYSHSRAGPAVRNNADHPARHGPHGRPSRRRLRLSTALALIAAGRRAVIPEAACQWQRDEPGVGSPWGGGPLQQDQFRWLPGGLLMIKLRI